MNAKTESFTCKYTNEATADTALHGKTEKKIESYLIFPWIKS